MKNHESAANFLMDNVEFVQQNINLYIKKKNTPTVTFFKRILGKQLCTKVCGSENRRQYVWATDEWLLYAHNQMGFQFCIFEPFSKTHAQKCWDGFYKIICEEINEI